MPTINSEISNHACRLANFTLFESPDITDLSAIDNGCPDVIAEIMDNHTANGILTSQQYYFLSELEPFVGTDCHNLSCFLKAAQPTSPLGRAILIIDRRCTLTEPLVLPSRFTLAGTGIDGEGGLNFSGLADGISAIRLASGAVNVTIRDLSIGQIDGGINIGIDLSNANKAYVRNVQVNGFFAGIYGSRPRTHAISVYLDHCNTFDNDYNIVLHRNAFHWRIRDCIMNQAHCWGLLIFGPRNDPAPPPDNADFGWGNDHLVSGCRIEGCGIGGAHLASDSAMLMINRFENNGGAGGVGVEIFSTARHTRLVANYFSANTVHIEPRAQDTQQWGTILA